MRSNLRPRQLNYVASAAIGAALALCGPAHAQTMVTATGGTALQEVVVTAQKREENLQTVPLSVSAVSGVTMQAMHVMNLGDLTATIPNVQIQLNAGLTNSVSYVIRGIGIVANPSPYVGTEVGTVIDGVPQTVNELGLLDRFDLERVEVLRGPQGTLFGANTTGGVVNIVTRQPTGKWDVEGQAGLGNYGSKNVSLALDFPIIDGVLAGKVDMANRSRKGFYTNLYNSEDIGKIDSTSLRGYLKWTPSDAVDVTLKIDGQQARNGTDVLLNISYPGEVFYRPDTPFDFKLYSDVPDQHNSDTLGETLTVNWKSGIGAITSITNYAEWKTRGYQDIAGIDVVNGYDQIGNTTGWQASEELRDVMHPNDKVEIMVGFFAQRWHYDSDGEGWLAFVQPGLIDETLAKQNTTNLALFTQVYWDVTDRLRLQIGGRASNEKVSMERADFFYFNPEGTRPFEGYGNLIGATQLPVDPNNPPVSGSHTWTNYGGKLGFDYKLADTVMGYGYYARGFKSGGFNGRISVATDLGPFDPEFVDSFELGLKSDLLDHHLRLNFAAFLNKWKDMQVDQVFFSGNPPVAHSAIINAAKATTSGAELEAQWLVGGGFHIDAALGYLHAHYDTFNVGSGPICPPPPAAQPTPCTTSYNGFELPYSPKFNGSLGMTYSTPIGAGEGSGTVQVTHNGAHWGNFTHASTEYIGSVTLLNAFLDWTPTAQKWTLSAWGRNLTDKKYLSLALDAPPIFTEGLLGPPREYGLDIRFKF